ncbi:2-dehydropantoate 2-reductase [Hellea balneolensis]|uniref:2-dehydropantoate 2-reductase n=1 Tax=Hellea balneolensis TaxID=287478 RepID=UPI00041A8058|nr:2-dehydropantoate 2-reductase [Hellea balneolensis]
MKASRLRVAIFGAGSIGCYLGGQLAHSGANITFIGRQRFKSDIESHGLTLTHFEREEISLSADQFTFSLTPKDIASADIILLTTKSQDTSKAAKSLAPHAKADAIIISFQNGVSNPDILRENLSQTVLGAVVPFNVTGTGPGRFHCGTEGDLTVEHLSDARLETLQTLFYQAGEGLALSHDILAVQWGKLLVNLNNALNTLTGGTLKQGLLQRDYRRALALVVEEGLNVVKSSGIEPAAFGKADAAKMIKILRLPNFAYKIIMNKIVKIDAAARSSMLDDLEMGRVSEIDYLQGEIVRLAKSTGLTAPYNTAIYEAVQAAFKRGVSPKMSGADILKLLKVL